MRGYLWEEFDTPQELCEFRRNLSTHHVEQIVFNGDTKKYVLFYFLN